MHQALQIVRCQVSNSTDENVKSTLRLSLYIYIYINKFPSHPCGWYVGLRVMHSILYIPSTALFWTERSDVVPGICWSHSSSLGVTAPSAPITTGTTLAFTFHVLYRSSFSPWDFSNFS